MKVLHKGHTYELDNRVVEPVTEAQTKQLLQFVNKEPGHERAGTTTQEVLRALIDRTRHCNNCLPHPNNERIIYHMRMALVLHEARALERKTEKGDLRPEFVPTGRDGHFDLAPTGAPLSARDLGELTPELLPYVPDWERKCSYD